MHNNVFCPEVADNDGYLITGLYQARVAKQDEIDAVLLGFAVADCRPQGGRYPVGWRMAVAPLGRVLRIAPLLP